MKLIGDAFAFSFILGMLLCQALWLFLALCSGFAERGQFFELTSHFQPFYFCFAFLLLVLSLFFVLFSGKRKFARLFLLSFMPVLTLSISAWRMSQQFWGDFSIANSGMGRDEIKILHCNLWGGRNKQKEKFLTLVTKEEPDVVAVSEVERSWSKALSEELKKNYPYSICYPHVGGVALFSKLPIEKGEVCLSRIGHRPRICSLIKSRSGKLVALDLVHPPTPIGPEARLKARNEEFEIFSTELPAASDRYILVGDLNCTPWSPYFQKLLQRGEFLDSTDGYGLQPTWPAVSALSHGLLRPKKFSGAVLPIDHCLVSRNIKTVERRVLEPVGSDHLPFVVKLALI